MHAVPLCKSNSLFVGLLCLLPWFFYWTSPQSVFCFCANNWHTLLLTHRAEWIDQALTWLKHTCLATRAWFQTTLPFCGPALRRRTILGRKWISSWRWLCSANCPNTGPVFASLVAPVLYYSIRWFLKVPLELFPCASFPAATTVFVVLFQRMGSVPWPLSTASMLHLEFTVDVTWAINSG